MGVYKRSDSPNYWISYTDAAGKRHRECAGPSREHAEILLGKLLEQKADKRVGIQRQSRITLNQFRPIYKKWAREIARKRSWERDERSLNILAVYFGEMALAEIQVAHIEEYRAKRVSGKIMGGKGHRRAGHATVNRELACLRSLLNRAEEQLSKPEYSAKWGVFRNHLRGRIKIPKKYETERTRRLEPDEVAKLMDELSGVVKEMVLFALLTSMRKSEVMGLVWDEIDMRGGKANLPAIRVKQKKDATYFLNQEALRILISRRKMAMDGCPYVFNENGKMVKKLYDVYRRAVKRAKIQDLTFHDLRHSFASALADEGVPLQTISRLLCHSSLQMTMRYINERDQTLQVAAGKAASLLHPEEKEDRREADAQTGPLAEVIPLERKTGE